MFDIKKYFGRRGSEKYSTEIDDEITKESPLKIRGDRPGTTTFNRNLVIGLSAFISVIFIFSMFYGMSPAQDKQKDESDVKDKKIVATNQPNSQLEKLPSSYDAKTQARAAAAAQRTESNMSMPPVPPIPDNYKTPPRDSYPSIDYSSSPSIPMNPPPVPGQMFTSPGSATPAVQPAPVNKEVQELEEARKSPIRFNLK